MKKSHIILLVGVAACIMILLSFMGDLSTYETLASARQKQGKTVTVIAQLDKSFPVDYDPLRNPNLTRFRVVDTLGNKAEVVYHFAKPHDMEKTDRIVLKGKMKGDIFEITSENGVLIKCPSKYKDDPKAAQKNLSQNNK